LIDGVLVVDKPQGMTSHDVVAVARRCLGESRIGHTGTLDPLATGVLPLACGRATRLVRFFTAAEKEYEAGIRFGLTTDSYDITGTETSRSGQAPTREAIEEALQPLRGDYLQTPPAYSAKKVGGRRAYEMARRAEPVTLEPVPVRVTRAELRDVSGATARVVVACSAGFYVRTFAHSLGERVGTGACLESLRRTRSGDFDLSMAVPLEELQRDPAAAVGRAVTMNHLLPKLPAARLTDEGRTRVLHGRDVDDAHLWREGEDGLENGRAEWVRLVDEAGQLLALGTPAAGKTGGRRALHPTVVLI
jgi:tRNA pseudouridine55 synthase